jgi:hypothetical protein
MWWNSNPPASTPSSYQYQAKQRMVNFPNCTNPAHTSLFFCKIDQLKQASSLILTFPSPPSALRVDIDRRGGLGACPHPESRIWAAVEVAGGAVTGSRWRIDHAKRDANSGWLWKALFSSGGVESVLPSGGRVWRWWMVAAKAAEVVAMVWCRVDFCCWCGCGLWAEVVGSLALPESISSIPYLNRQFRKSKSIITI